MAQYYDLIRGLHILAVIAWMAGLLYLPRLFVYHVKATPGSEMDETFKTMERRLQLGIMTPAMIVAWIFGLMLLDIRTAHFSDPGLMLQPWLATKLAGVVFQTGWHHFHGREPQDVRAGRQQAQREVLARGQRIALHRRHHHGDRRHHRVRQSLERV